VKGAALVAIAVIVGIVLLQIVDPGKSGPAGARTTNTTRETTTTTHPKSTAKTTTTTAARRAPQKTPAQLHLIVLNAGAPTGSAGHVSQNLKNKGYSNQGTATDTTTKVSGIKVECQAGLAREQTALVTLLNPGVTQATLAAPLPTNAAGYECVVLVGSG